MTTENKLPKQILRNGGIDKAGICFRCGKPVDPKKAAVLEQDGRIAEWHDFGMPPGMSLGPVLFGQDCARSLRKRARHDLESDPADDESQADYCQRMKALIEADLQAVSSEEMRLYYEFMLNVLSIKLTTLK